MELDSYRVKPWQLLTHITKSLKDSSPFSKFFADSVADVDCEHGTDCASNQANPMYSPLSFQVIRDIIHLYPLWSAALQSSVERFAADSSVAVDCTELPTCRSNATVESHFKSVKHERLDGRLRVHPREFMLAELQYIQGKLNERSLPKVQVRKKNEIQSREEKWQCRKRSSRYADCATASKVLKSVASKATSRYQRSVAAVAFQPVKTATENVNIQPGFSPTLRAPILLQPTSSINAVTTTGHAVPIKPL